MHHGNVKFLIYLFDMITALIPFILIISNVAQLKALLTPSMQLPWYAEKFTVHTLKVVSLSNICSKMNLQLFNVIIVIR